jgi:hypothetical protein
MSPLRKQQDLLRSILQTTDMKVLKKYKCSMLRKQKKQFFILRSALPCNNPSSDLQTVFQAIKPIRNLQMTLMDK